jgi:hypothetical protein
MAKYLLTIYEPDGVPDPAMLDEVIARLHQFNDELRAAGSWVFTGGLEAPAESVVLRADGSATDGPFAETKEHIGGFWVIEAPDRETAVEWGRKASRATTLPIEVRAFQRVDPY